MSQEELVTLLLILSTLCFLANATALIYARLVARKRREALSKRPLAAILFAAIQVLTLTATLELVYLTALFIGRASYSITVAHPAEIPGWVGYLATGQYFVYYAETFLVGIILTIVSLAFKTLDTNKGPFGAYGTEPDPGVFPKDHRLKKEKGDN